IEIPKLVAFCLTAPGVRFIALAMAFTRVLLFECFFNSLTSCAVHSRRTVRFFPFTMLSSEVPTASLGVPECCNRFQPLAQTAATVSNLNCVQHQHLLSRMRSNGACHEKSYRRVHRHFCLGLHRMWNCCSWRNGHGSNCY